MAETYETIEITRAITIDGVYYDGQLHIVTKAVADKLVKSGAAFIIDPDTPAHQSPRPLKPAGQGVTHGSNS